MARRRMVTVEKLNETTGKWGWAGQHFEDKIPAMLEEMRGWGWQVRAVGYQHVIPL